MCLSHPSLCELKTGHHGRRLDLNVCVGFLLEARGGFRGGCPQVIFSLHLFLRTIYQVCVCVCVRVGGRCTGAGVLLLLGCQGGPDLPQPAVNPQMWRVGGFDCYSISGPPPPPCFALWRCQAEAGGEGTGSQGMNSSSK